MKKKKNKKRPQQKIIQKIPRVIEPSKSKIIFKTFFKKLKMQFIGIISLIIGVLGIIFLVYPRVNITPGESLNTKDPFQTPFILKNDGYLQLKNVSYIISVERIETPDGGIITGFNLNLQRTVSILGANKSTALFVNNTASGPPGYISVANVSIVVKYQPYLIPIEMTENFRFKVELKNNGDYVWYENYYYR